MSFTRENYLPYPRIKIILERRQGVHDAQRAVLLVRSPACGHRILGIQWIANTLYPEAYDIDMIEVTKKFYSLLYHANVTDEQAREILGNSYNG